MFVSLSLFFSTTACTFERASKHDAHTLIAGELESVRAQLQAEVAKASKLQEELATVQAQLTESKSTVVSANFTRDSSLKCMQSATHMHSCEQAKSRMQEPDQI